MTKKTAEIKIGIDAMGSDSAPESEVLGAFAAWKSDNQGFIPVFFGNKDRIESELKKIGSDEFVYEIVESENDVTMKDDPMAAVKSKQKSSMYLGFDYLKQGKIHSFSSAGNTGAMLTTATLTLGRINGVSRPTIGTFFPLRKNKAVLLVDAGATIDANARYLYEFGVMGNIYVNQAFNIESPRIGLLNIGEESSKGISEYKEANKLLSESEMNFIGNVEGQDIFADKADVVVCDGFTGNILLKFAESFITILKTKMKEFAGSSSINALKALMTKGTLKEMLKDFDYQEYGGVPLLGVNGIVYIGHGKSTPKAIKNMLLNSLNATRSGLVSKIENAINNES
jgi:glycerol-3-phosphate acyltransferase PlsX